MKYIKINKNDLGSIDFNTINDNTSLLAYFIEENDSMGFTVPDNETFMPNETQLTESEFNQEYGGVEGVQLIR
jgi:hypothetical protein